MGLGLGHSGGLKLPLCLPATPLLSLHCVAFLPPSLLLFAAHHYHHTCPLCTHHFAFSPTLPALPYLPPILLSHPHPLFCPSSLPAFLCTAPLPDWAGWVKTGLVCMHACSLTCSPLLPQWLISSSQSIIYPLKGEDKMI